VNVDNSVNEHLVHVGARVEPALAEAVAQLAREGDRSLSRQVRRALSEHVAQHLPSVASAPPLGRPEADERRRLVGPAPEWVRWPARTSRPRTSSGWRSSKGSSGKETRPSGDRHARVRWAPSDGPASDRRPLAQMAPAPSEPRATPFSSRAPAVHRPFGLSSAACDLLVPARVARPRAPDPGAARADRGRALRLAP
jgi:hypothetical protein